MPPHTTPIYNAVVLLSGGLDSAYNLACAMRRYSPLLILTFDYGQRARRPELKAARTLAAIYKAEHRVIKLPWLRELAPAAIVTPGMPLPARAGRITDIWVPNRNGVFVAAAAAYAEKHKAPYIVAGFNREEAVDFNDNSTAFIRATNKALAYSCAHKVELVSFSARLTKAEIIKKAARLGIPLAKVYPCYGEGPRPCGKCISCRRMARGLRKAGLAEVEARIFLPESKR